MFMKKVFLALCSAALCLVLFVSCYAPGSLGAWL